MSYTATLFKQGSSVGEGCQLRARHHRLRAVVPGNLDNYYYLSLMAAVLTVVLATAIPDRWSLARNVVAWVMLAGALAAVPGRLALRDAASDPRVRAACRGFSASRPAPSDPTFVYSILGARIDPTSPWIATIRSTGDVDFRKVD